MEPQSQRQALADFSHPFSQRLQPTGLKPLSLKTFQINVGKRCNQACRHCHVDASPIRTEMMSAETVTLCLGVLAQLPEVEIVDITGGAPELSPYFKTLVEGARALGKRVIDRCNLTILTHPGYEWLPNYLHQQGVEIVASLPHWSASLTDRQRGNGVFSSSLTGLRLLNDLGYGTDLPLDLVYNPGGFFLTGDQVSLEREYKHKLGILGLNFHNLLCLNNMPVSRFLESLLQRGQFEEYLQTLAQAYNPQTEAGLMCRHQISIGYEGSIYDCDFNQMLEIPASPTSHLNQFDRNAFMARHIRVANHCYGCTAGAGSSCGGTLA
jgi:radical SAM/Cys-rich protein